MPPTARLLLPGLAALALAGCAEPTETPVTDTASGVVAPETTPIDTPVPTEPTPAPEIPAAEAPPAETPAADGISYEPIKFDALLKTIAENDAKYTLVDCWASWCGPCKENFPHVLEMDKKFADKGLKVISLAFDGGMDDPEMDAKEIESGRAFLVEKKAEITNYRLDEERGEMFERFDVSTIPAVFVYDADGKEVKRYTWDDPNNQFTYEQVEKEVAELLGASPE